MSLHCIEKNHNIGTAGNDIFPLFPKIRLDFRNMNGSMC